MDNTAWAYIAIAFFLAILCFLQMKNTEENDSNHVRTQAQAHFRGGYLEGYDEGLRLSRQARSNGGN